MSLRTKKGLKLKVGKVVQFLQNIAGSGVQLSFSTAAVIFAALLTLIITIFVLVWFLRQKIRSEFKTRYALEQSFEMLFASPDGYFAWLYGCDDKAPKVVEVCSRRLAVLLGLDNGVKSSFADLLDKVAEADKKPLLTAVDELKKNGRNFSLEIHGKDTAKRIIVMGCKVQNSLKTVLADTLWLRDITAPSDSMDQLYSLNHYIENKYNVVRAIIDALPFPFWATSDDLKLTYCNEAYADAVGAKSCDEVVENNLELATGDVLVKCHNLASRAKKSKSVQTSKEHIVIKGRRRYVRLSERFLDGQEGEFHCSSIGMAIPIDDEEELEIKLKGYIGAHDEVLKNLTSAIVIFDGDKRLSFYNQPFVNLFGLDEDWLDTHPIYSQFLDVLREKRMLPEERDFAAFKAKELELFSTLVAPSDTFLYLPMEKILRRFIFPYHLGGILISYEDVTDRILLQRSYSELIEVQKATIDNIHEAIALFDDEGRLNLYNSYYMQLWHFSEDFLKTKPTLAELIEMHKVFFTEDEAEWDKFKQEILGVLEDGKQAGLKLERRDNIILDVSRVALADGGVLVAFADITSTETKDKLKEQEIRKMSRKDTLISGFISDLDKGFIQPLRDVKALAAKLPNSNIFVDKAENIETAFTDLMNFAKSQTETDVAEASSFDVNKMLQDIVSDIAHRAKSKDIKISFTGDKNFELIVVLDEIRFGKMLFFIASAALNMVGKGGKIVISADKDDNEARIVFAPRFIPSSDSTALKEFLGAGADLVQLCALSLGVNIGFDKTGEFASLVVKAPLYKG